MLARVHLLSSSLAGLCRQMCGTQLPAYGMNRRGSPPGSTGPPTGDGGTAVPLSPPDPLPSLPRPALRPRRLLACVDRVPQAPSSSGFQLGVANRRHSRSEGGRECGRTFLLALSLPQGLPAFPVLTTPGGHRWHMASRTASLRGPHILSVLPTPHTCVTSPLLKYSGKE